MPTYPHNTVLINESGQSPTLVISGSFSGAMPAATFVPLAATGMVAAGDVRNVDASGAAVVITAPATPVDGDRFVLRFDDLTNAVTLGGGTFDGPGAAGAAVTAASLGETYVYEYKLASATWVAYEV